MWAYGDEPFWIHDTYGWFAFTIDPINGQIHSGEQRIADVDTWFLTHGIVLYICWGLFGAFMITSGRHLLSFWKYMYLVHRTMGDVIFFTSLYFEVVAYKKVGTLADNHNKAGFYFIFFGATLGIMGNIYAGQSYSWVTDIIPAKYFAPFKYLHFSLAYTGLLYAQYVILTGIWVFDRKMNTNDHTYLFWIHSLLILSVLIMNEVLYQQQVYAYSRVITD